MKGYPDNNPKTRFGIRKVPLHLIPPVALLHEAMALGDGAGKYGPYNWREKDISSSVYFAAVLRHLFAWWDGENKASDSGVHHLGHARACLALILDGAALGKLNDDRPTPGSTSAVLAALSGSFDADPKIASRRQRGLRRPAADRGSAAKSRVASGRGSQLPRGGAARRRRP